VTTAETAVTSGSPEVARTWREIQRVILPSTGQEDVVPLYVDAGSSHGVRLVEDDSQYRKPRKLDEKLNLVSSQPAEAHYEDFLSRESMAVRPGQHVSFGTYYNAFPASYWRRWTAVRRIRLVVETQGRGTVVVYRSNARGLLQRVDSSAVDGQSTSAFELDLAPFGDGGWYWFDLSASRDGIELVRAHWDRLVEAGVGTTGEDPALRPSVLVEITTLNKPAFCIENARQLAAHPEVLDRIEEILIVDQGTQHVRQHPDFSEVESSLRGRLRVIEQSNLGGSGGFARGMFEAVENGFDYVLLLDDDVVVEPESIVRLVTFAEHCKRPTLVGGHMFDLHARTVLHAYAEVVDPYRITPEIPRIDMRLRHDFVDSNLRQTPWLHRRADADYNGWWMCLIPTAVIREVGLSLPLFIKWDDIEYGLRAKKAGFPTVSLPGAGLWHVSWEDKQDDIGWQAYFYARNRLVAALLHSPFAYGGRILRESFQIDVKHLFSMQYYAEALRSIALADVRRGPDVLHADLHTKLPDAVALRGEYSEAQFMDDVDDFPPPHSAGAPRGIDAAGSPTKKELIPWAAKAFVRQLTRKVTPDAVENPQANLAHKDNKWWRLASYDSVVITNAEGTASSWYRRRPELLKPRIAKSASAHAALRRDWASLSAVYREAAARVTSLDAWRETFARHTHTDSGRNRGKR
jgi:galactofuranosylgalactofuranosylrhamnosyl-N-acetylglucosaminyl-diphospho-decaprenol beta-1,5/1,6-galactofuranosyltransferase